MLCGLFQFRITYEIMNQIRHLAGLLERRIKAVARHLPAQRHNGRVSKPRSQYPGGHDSRPKIARPLRSTVNNNVTFYFLHTGFF